MIRKRTFGAMRISGVVTIAAVIAVSAFQSAEAQSRRPDTRSMTCAQAQATVDQRGAIVMSTGTHTFDRFVANRSYCQRGEDLWRERVKTKDNPQCFLNICVNRSRLRFR